MCYTNGEAFGDGIARFEQEVMTMKTFVCGIVSAGVLAMAGCAQTASESALAGPNEGDLISIRDGTAYGELLANTGTGEAVVLIWTKDLKTSLPIENEPLTLGSGKDSVELPPHPMDSDPSGKSSRFHGQADWLRGGSVHQGWLHGASTGGHKDFEWRRCWLAGRKHSHIWEEMAGHEHMGHGHEMGHDTKEM
jgi:hypothetical protein